MQRINKDYMQTLYTVEEAAKLTFTPKKNLKELIAVGKIEYVCVGVRTMISLSAILKFLDQVSAGAI